MTEANTLLSLADFAPRLNEAFSVDLDGSGTYPLILTEALALPARGPKLAREPFQLHFRGPGPNYLMQRIHALENEVLGKIEVFLVPVGQEGDDFVYQAVFN